jgi:hypothetical protein
MRRVDVRQHPEPVRSPPEAADRVHPLLLLQRLAGNHAVVVQRGKKKKKTNEPPRRSLRIAQDRLDQADIEVGDDADEDEILTKSRLLDDMQHGGLHFDFKENSRVTRGQKKKMKELKKLGKMSVEQVKAAQARVEATRPPTQLQTGVALFVGNRSFRADFANAFWTQHHPLPVNCAATDCGNPITAGATGGDGPSIDHIIPWSTLRLGLDPVVVCKNGIHWDAVLQSTVDAANENLRNLQPVHARCNSSMGGVKGTDDIRPTRSLEQCPGAACTRSKAE